MAETIGFIGLGALGSPIAANLLEAGYPLRVYNRTASKADALVAHGAERAARPVDAVQPGGIVMTILWGDESVEGVVASDDFAERLGPGGVHVSMSTISPEACGRLAALHARHGSHFVEAPLFGRPATALTKQMFVPVCGPQAAKDRVRPVLEAMGARGVYDFGEQIGAAATVKLVGNYLLICAGTALNEGLTIVKKSGFDQQAALDMLTATLFPGPIYQNYGRMLSEPAQAMNQSGIPLKDLSIFMDMARDTATAAPLLEQLRDLLKVPT